MVVTVNPKVPVGELNIPHPLMTEVKVDHRSGGCRVIRMDAARAFRRRCIRPRMLARPDCGFYPARRLPLRAAIAWRPSMRFPALVLVPVLALVWTDARAAGCRYGQDLCYDGSSMVAALAPTRATAHLPRQDGRFGRDAKAKAGTLTKSVAAPPGSTTPRSPTMAAIWLPVRRWQRRHRLGLHPRQHYRADLGVKVNDAAHLRT